MNKIIYVFCGLDLHKDIIKICIDFLKKHKKNVDVGVATFGNANLPPSKELKKMCEDLSLPFYDCPRQTYNNLPLVHRAAHINADVDCCELTGMFEVSTYFYQNYDYDMVVLMHPDTITIRDYDNSIEKHLGEDYCLVAPLINLEPNKPLLNKDIFIEMDGFEIAKTSFRVTQSVVSFGKKFCLHMIKKYETIENIWHSVFKNLIKYGDCSMIDFYPVYEGFSTYLLHDKEQVVSQESFGEHHTKNLNYYQFLLNNKNYNFIHIGHPPAGWYPDPRIPGAYAKEKYINYLFAMAKMIMENDNK